MLKLGIESLGRQSTSGDSISQFAKAQSPVGGAAAANQAAAAAAASENAAARLSVTSSAAAVPLPDSARRSTGGDYQIGSEVSTAAASPLPESATLSRQSSSV